MLYNHQINLRCTEESSPDACETFDIFAEFLEEGKYLGLVILKKALNYEERSSYNIVVEASDNGEGRVLTSSSNILVQVEDVQDQDPVFLNAPYSATVPEDSPEVFILNCHFIIGHRSSLYVQGTEIFEIQVRDGDTGIPRPIRVELEGDTLGYFVLEEREVTRENVLIVSLRTTQNIIDRENPQIIREGGLYAFKVMNL